MTNLVGKDAAGETNSAVLSQQSVYVDEQFLL